MLSLDKLGPTFSALVFVFVPVIYFYIIASTALFIIDAIKAKKQSRKIKTGFKIMFIIAMVFAAISLALGIYVLVVMGHLFVYGPF